MLSDKLKVSPSNVVEEGGTDPSLFSALPSERALSRQPIEVAAQAFDVSIGTDKINDTNKKMQRAQEDALKAQVETNRLQEVMNTQLEQQVRERTEELWNQTKGMTVILENLNQGICKIDGSYSIAGATFFPHGMTSKLPLVKSFSQKIMKIPRPPQATGNGYETCYVAMFVFMAAAEGESLAHDRVLPI